MHFDELDNEHLAELVEVADRPRFQRVKPLGHRSLRVLEKARWSSSSELVVSIILALYVRK